MAVSYSAKKCDSCGGSLEYIKEKKVWRCRYCGQEIVREEQYDGLFTIKNVARQSVLDTAYRRMDQANQNLTECEKIDARYIGTLIARICYRLIAVITPEACRAEEARGMYQRLKDDYAALRQRGDAIDEDEEALYEFFGSADSASDAFATLILVFDTLGDAGRTEHLFQLLEPEKIYSKFCNRDLLTYALKHEKFDLARPIAANTTHLDLPTALHIVPQKCPDGEEKAEMAAKLLGDGAYDSQDRQQVRDYLASPDSCRTKAAVVKACKGTGAMPDMETIVQHVLSQAGPEETSCVLDGVCSGSLPDSELYYLMEYGLSERAEKAILILDRIVDSGQFSVIGAKQLGLVFPDTRRPAGERLAIWEHLQRLRLDNKAVETVLMNYLCTGADTPEDRKILLDALLSRVSAVSPTCMERYLQGCTLDGDGKPAVVASLLALKDMKPGFFSELLGKYVRRTPDSEAVTKAVVDVLLQAGLTLDAGSINDLICRSGPAAEKVELLQRLEHNGCRLRADALSVYLENCGADFREELFAYLFERASVVSEKALSNYVLSCACTFSTKAQNALALSQKQATPFGASMCQIVHLSHRISCNLAQGYLLTTGDPYETAAAVLNAMSGSSKLTADMEVDGRTTRMKKYVKENRGSLSPLTAQLCEDYKLFSLF